MALNMLRIVVVDGGKADSGTFSDDGGGQGAKQPSGNKSTLYKMLNLNQTMRNKFKQATSPTTFFAVQSGINLATQTARQFVNYYVSDIGRRNGDSNYQAIVNRRIEQVTDGLSIGQGMLNGAAAGAMAGPVGAAIGLMAGAASSAVSLGFKYAARERAYQHVLFQERNSQAYSLARANYTALTGRVR